MSEAGLINPPGYLDPAIDRWKNADLLLADDLREEFAREEPQVFRVLDWPEFRDVFQTFDVVANARRKATRRWGGVAIALGVLGIVAIEAVGLSDLRALPGLASPSPPSASCCQPRRP